jgi:hypothetical protein
MSESISIDIANDFSKRPGARYIKEGKNSGQLFLEQLLEPKFIEARQKDLTLVIYLDGVMGYPSSFVSGSFGKLSLAYGKDLILKTLKFQSSNPLRIEKIIMEIENPTKK